MTYSKDGHKKKQRRWLDGTLKFDLESRFATLSAEDGKFVASGPIPSQVEIQDDSEEFVLEAPSILVVISSITCGNDVLPRAKKENTCQPVAHGGVALRRPFAPPLASFPPTTTSVSTVEQRSTLHSRLSWQQQQQQHQQPPISGRIENVSANTNAPGHPVQHTKSPVKRQERTKEAIMRLLSGKMVDNNKLSAFTAVEPGNPLKKQRLLLSSETNQPFHQQPQPPAAMQHQRNNNNNNNVEITLERVPQLPLRAPPSASALGFSGFLAPPLPQPQPVPPALTRTVPLPPGHSLVGAPVLGQWNPRFNTNNAISNAVLPLLQSSTGGTSSRQPLAAPVAAAPLPGTLYFPQAEESSKPVRRVAVSDRFSNADAYRNAWEDSLNEEMTLKITEVAKDFHSAAAAATARHAAGVVGAGVVSGSVIEAAMRKARVPYYSSCELFIWKNYPGKKNNGGNFAGGRKKKKKGDDADADADGDGDAGSSDFTTNKPENVYLILKSGRAKNVEYSKGDLWIVSNDPFMRSGFGPGQVGDRNRAPWVAVARSTWFGPNQDGKFEIEFLSSRPSNLGRSTPVYAVKGPNASIELNILDVLKSPSLAALPLLKSILGATPLSFNPDDLNKSPRTLHTGYKVMDGDEVALEQQKDDELSKAPAELAEAVIQKFTLNDEQATVVRHVATWATNSTTADKAAPPVCLVFGPFGCGKSSLLVAVLHLLLKLRNLGAGADGSANPLSQSRVLVSAHTNVAVDRVLDGLLESGCTDFLRVGPLRRIDRKLLSHSLHASESKTHANAAAELKDMLHEGQGKMSPTEEAALRAELAAMAAGAERKRKKMLKTVPIVGVTCCSSLLPVLEDFTFDIVILDECSQIIEPLAMAPILRAKAKFLVAAGDPKQLPPVIANPPRISPPPKLGLLRPLFVRLSDLGATPHLLRQQYRCHPALSAIPNAQFYQGRLLDGCTKQQRPSLLPGLPPSVFVDVRDGREQYVMRSTANSSEAYAVVRVVEKAIAAGVDPSKVGVICFYRAQVQEVQNTLHGKATLLQAAFEKAAQAAQEQKQSLEKSEEHDGGHQEKATRTSEQPRFFTSIQVATVDAFQGAEKDLIILTTATTRPGSFIADAARLNVALTRAKNNLVVVGCGHVLERTAPAFAALIQAAKTTPAGYHIGTLN